MLKKVESKRLDYFCLSLNIQDLANKTTILVKIYLTLAARYMVAVSRLASNLE